ncbi:MAG: serine/threonine-protein kinase [Planctomycetes bacterium]|nr:serine/threonine-protein kinase [Planctomycetota bacterium]
MKGTGSTDGRNPVELLAEEFVARLRRGEAATVEEYIERHPHLASEIRRALTPLRLLEQAGREETAPEEPVTIAGYRIVRELGRGGMGVVYEADQLSLSRRVALKVLGATVSESPAHRERFRREAEAAARLHHTNIVPVFGAGEDGGRAYYVMQLIEGVTLREVLGAMDAKDRQVPFTGKPAAGHAAALLLKGTGRAPGARREEDPRASRPEYFRRVAKLGMFVARALAHAHLRGILHRDIKPSNIMLDRTGAVWVTDFGLAKLLDREDLTTTGDAVGTVRYMAPEQFLGHVDERSEIYSLGLTLHELLTLRPAFGDRQHAALMKKKLAGAPPSPRSLAPHLPRDLETIVCKACALEPRHRYLRAADLEDDLRRFLEGQPVAARRTRPPERLWRWARRNPVVAALGSVTALLLVVAVLVFAVSNRRTRRALDLVAEEKSRVEEALRKLEEESEKAVASATLAKKESARAEENLGVALLAFDRILRNLSSRGAPGSLDLVLDREVSGVTPADVELLTTLLDFFERFADRNQVDLGAESARALTQVGDIQRKLGRLPDSIASYRKALDAFRSLGSETGASDLTLEQAKILNAIATTQSRAGIIREAFGTYREARQLLQGDPAADRADFRFELARNLVLVATVGERTGMRHEDSSDVGERGDRRGRGRPGRRGATAPGRRSRSSPECSARTRKDPSTGSCWSGRTGPGSPRQRGRRSRPGRRARCPRRSARPTGWSGSSPRHRPFTTSWPTPSPRGWRGTRRSPPASTGLRGLASISSAGTPTCLSSRISPVVAWPARAGSWPRTAN